MLSVFKRPWTSAGLVVWQGVVPTDPSIYYYYFAKTLYSHSCTAGMPPYWTCDSFESVVELCLTPSSSSHGLPSAHSSNKEIQSPQCARPCETKYLSDDNTETVKFLLRESVWHWLHMLKMICWRQSEWKRPRMSLKCSLLSPVFLSFWDEGFSV